MAEEKRIKVSADVTPLRQLREEAISVYREINQSVAQNSREMERNLQQLKQQLALMSDRNGLEKLLIDLKRQQAGIADVELERSKQRQIESIDMTERKTISQENRLPEIEESTREASERPSEPVYDEETNSLTWDVQPQEKPKPKKQKKFKKKQDIDQEEEIESSEPVYDEETNSLTWDVPSTKKRKKTPSIERELKTPIQEEQLPKEKESVQETLREINRHVENIDESVTNTDKSIRNVDESREDLNFSTKIKTSENINESTRNIDRSTQNVDKSIRSVDESQEQIDRSVRNINESQEQVDRSSRNIDESKESINESREKIDRSTRNIDESQEQIDRSVRNVDESKKNIDKSIKEVDESVNEEKKTYNRNEVVENNVLNRNIQTSNITENIRNIEKNVENIQENTAVLKEQDPVEKTSSVTEKVSREPELNTPLTQNRSEKTEEQREVIVKLNDDNLLKAFGSLESVVREKSEDIVEKLSELITGEEKKEEVDLTGVNRYLNTLADSVSRIEDYVEEISKERQRTSRGSGERTSNINPTNNVFPFSLQGGMSGGLFRFLGPLAGAFSILSILNSAKDTVIQRDLRNREFEYQAPMMSSIEQQASKTRLEGQNEADKYRWVPLVGDYLSRRTEMKYNALAEAQQVSRQTRLSMEANMTGYAQTLGTSVNRSFGEMSREGGYAARALGMDIGEYAARRAQIVRSGGGMFRGGDEYDPTAIRETQSLMAVEKKYGLRGVDQLQQAMRFGDRVENLGSSAVIRSFERTMEKLNLSFTEIASTLDESLATFTSEANKILEKKGEYDSATLATTLAGAREYTGFSGRQLERVQQMVTGSTLAEDDVTNAIVMRAIQQNTGASTYSQVMAEKEGLAENPEVMKAVLKDAQNMTSNNEQFMQMLNKMFTNLSWSDLQDLTKVGGGRIDIDDLFEVIKQSRSEIGKEGEEKGIKQVYEKTEGQGAVGSETAWSASDRDRLLGAVDEIKSLLSQEKEKAAERERIREREQAEYRETFKNNPAKAIWQSISKAGNAMSAMYASPYIRSSKENIDELNRRRMKE